MGKGAENIGKTTGRGAKEAARGAEGAGKVTARGAKTVAKGTARATDKAVTAKSRNQEKAAEDSEGARVTGGGQR